MKKHLFKVVKDEEALNGYLETYRIDGEEGYDVDSFFKETLTPIIKLIKKKKKPIKLKFILKCLYYRKDADGEEGDADFGYFHSKKPEVITKYTNLPLLLDSMMKYLIELSEQFETKNTGWIFDSVVSLKIYTDKFDPMSGSSYIPLPPALASKKAIINIKNERDNECFKWAVTSAIYPVDKHPERLNEGLRLNSEKLDWSGIEFPISPFKLDKFERQNPYKINVYGYDTIEGIYILRIGKKKPEDEVIDLLLISDEESGKQHYCWIKNKSRLLSSQINNHKGASFFCDMCLSSFQSKDSKDKHEEYCSENEAIRIDMPIKKDGSPEYITFSNYNRKMRVPIIVIADFESCLNKIST